MMAVDADPPQPLLLNHLTHACPEAASASAAAFPAEQVPHTPDRPTAAARAHRIGDRPAGLRSGGRQASAAVPLAAAAAAAAASMTAVAAAGSMSAVTAVVETLEC